MNFGIGVRWRRKKDSYIVARLDGDKNRSSHQLRSSIEDALSVRHGEEKIFCKGSFDFEVEDDKIHISPSSQLKDFYEFYKPKNGTISFVDETIHYVSSSESDVIKNFYREKEEKLYVFTSDKAKRCVKIYSLNWNGDKKIFTKNLLFGPAPKTFNLLFGLAPKTFIRGSQSLREHSRAIDNKYNNRLNLYQYDQSKFDAYTIFLKGTEELNSDSLVKEVADKIYDNIRKNLRYSSSGEFTWEHNAAGLQIDAVCHGVSTLFFNLVKLVCMSKNIILCSGSLKYEQEGVHFITNPLTCGNLLGYFGKKSNIKGDADGKIIFSNHIWVSLTLNDTPLCYDLVTGICGGKGNCVGEKLMPEQDGSFKDRFGNVYRQQESTSGPFSVIWEQTAVFDGDSG